MYPLGTISRSIFLLHHTQFYITSISRIIFLQLKFYITITQFYCTFFRVQSRATAARAGSRSSSTGNSVEQQQHGQGQWSSSSTGRVSGAAAARAETTGDRGEAAARVRGQGRRSSTGARAWEIDEVALEIEDHVRVLLVHRIVEAASGDAGRRSRQRTRRSSRRTRGSTRRTCAGLRRMRGSSRRNAHGLEEDVVGDSGDARR